MRPATFAPGTRSFIRLRQRMHGGLPAAGRPDHGRDQVAVDVQRDILHREVRAVVDAQAVDPEDGLAVLDRSFGALQARGDVDLGHIGGHGSESRAPAERPGLRDVNTWCRGGERASGAFTRLLKLSTHGCSSVRAAPARARLQAFQTRPCRRRRAGGRQRLRFALRARPHRPDHLQDRRRRLAGDAGVRPVVRLGARPGTRTPPSSVRSTSSTAQH